MLPAVPGHSTRLRLPALACRTPAPEAHGCSVTGDVRLALCHVRHAAPRNLAAPGERTTRPPTEVSRARGRAAFAAGISRSSRSRLAPVTRCESFAPTRSARAPPVMTSPPRWLETPAALARSHPTARPRRVVLGAPVAWGQGPHRPLSREEDRTPPHPRCLPSMSRPAPIRAGSSAEAAPPSCSTSGWCRIRRRGSVEHPSW